VLVLVLLVLVLLLLMRSSIQSWFERRRGAGATISKRWCRRRTVALQL